MAEEQKIGLALGGGAVLGAIHVGVLRAIEKLNIPIHYISGTSIGSVIGALFAFGKSSEEIEHIFEELTWFDISALSLSQYGLLSNEKLGKLITTHIGEVNIEQAEIPLTIIATDASNGDKIELKKGPVHTAVMASAAIPGIFKPIKMDNRLLMDGGIVENIPTQTLKDNGADFVIGVDLHTGFRHEEPANIIDVILNSFHFSILSAARIQTRVADILIQPDLQGYNRTDPKQVKKLIKLGYDESLPLIEQSKALQ